MAMEPEIPPPVPADLLDTPQAGTAAIRGGALRVAGYGVGMLLALAGGALLLRHLGVAESGRYITVIAITTIAAGISDFGLTSIAVRELSVRTGADRAQIAGSLLGLRVALSLAGVAGALAFTVLVGYPQRMVAGAALAGLGVVLSSVQITLSASLMSRLRLGWVTAIELLRQSMTLALIGVGVAGGLGLVPFLAIPIAAGVVITIVTAALVHGDIPLRPRMQVREWAVLGREVLPFSLAITASVIYFRIAVIVVSLVASSHATGLFGASFRVIETVVVLPNLVVGAAFPIFARAARDDRGRLAYALQRMFEVCVVLGVGLGLLLALTPHVAISIIGGAQFSDAADVLRIQAVAVATGFLNALWGYLMLSLTLYRRALLVNLAALLFGGVLAAVLASTHGAIGAGVATAIAEVGLVITAGFAVRSGNEDLMPSLVVLPRVALAAVLAGAIVLVPGVPELADAAVAAVVFSVAVLVLRVVPPEIINEARLLAARGRA